MENTLLHLLNKGGPLGILLVFLVVFVALGLWVRKQGFLSVEDAARNADNDNLSSINTKLGSVDRRLTEVEHDLQNRPTRDELHRLEISVTQLDGRMSSIEKTTTATNHAVNRIEEHLLRGTTSGK